jgi:hypothetical protein
MSGIDRRLAELLAPVREEAVSALLRALAGAIEAGGEVEAEPMRRGPDGQVLRGGPLDLPARGDLLVTRDGRSLPQRVESPEPDTFPPLSLVADGGFTVVIAPFRWGEARMMLESRQAKPDWQPLRLWALEWIQSRHADVSPDLAGAIHALEGPEPVRGGFAFGVDFGSAPVEAIAALIPAAAATGAGRLRLGTPDEP